jgi:23S rRNA pseudouridine2605 synthase
MPPRHAYWTILIDDQPTAFRAHDPEELLPTLNRLREKNESAVMKWFERGQLFDSRDAARDAGLGKGERRWEGPRPERRDDAAGAERPDRNARDRRPAGEGRPRDKNWRPGGEHRDPRQKYKDAKKAKWNRFKDKIRERHEQRSARDPETFTPPHGDKLSPPEGRPRGPRAGWSDQRESRSSDRNTWRDAPRPPRSDARPEDRDGRPSRPHGDKFRPREDWRDRDTTRPPRNDWRDRDSRPAPRTERRDDWRGDRRDERSDRGGGAGYNQRPRSSRPPRSDWRDERDAPRGPRGDEQREWKPKPAGGFKKKPFGAKPFGAKPFGAKFGGKPPGGKPYGAKPSGPRKPWGSKPGGSSRPPSGGFRDRDASRPPRRRRDDEE